MHGQRYNSPMGATKSDTSCGMVDFTAQLKIGSVVLELADA